MQTSSSSFSVEQVELIRRLRNSGIRCQQLIEAFQALERIDARFGNIFNSPVTTNNVQHAKPNSHPTTTVGFSAADSGSRLLGQPTSSAPPTGVSPVSRLPPLAGASQNWSRHVSEDPHVTHRSAVLPPPNLSNGMQSASHVMVNDHWDSQVHPENGGAGHSTLTSQNGPSPPSGQARSHAAELKPDQCLILLQCTSEDKVVEFVKKCLLAPEFKPPLNPQEIGVTEEAMLAFLWGDVFSIDQSSRNKLLEWIISMFYLQEWFTAEMAKLLLLQGCGDGFDVQFTPRRERFTFRDKHLDVLESFWRKKQYPTYEEKEHIAEECNYAMAAELQRGLEEREKMTHVNVANWFKNKRKEIKRVLRKVPGDVGTEPGRSFLDRLNLAAPPGAERSQTDGAAGPLVDHMAEVSHLTSDLKPSTTTTDTPYSGEAAAVPSPSSSSSSLSLKVKLEMDVAEENSGITNGSCVSTNSSAPSNTSSQIMFPNFSHLMSSYPVGGSVLTSSTSALVNLPPTATSAVVENPLVQSIS